MTRDPVTTRAHYDTLLAKNYLWMAGGFENNCERNRTFFSAQGITPEGTGIAVDLGAGCGFQSVPLAGAGFSVVAVDFSQQMLDILRQHATTPRVRTVWEDILSFRSWAGQNPELITCMGDTLTHLPGPDAVRGLLRQCANELTPGGKLVISCRDYSPEPTGSTQVIPVRRDADRIFLCRLDYDLDCVRVTDILYSRESGSWERVFGTYRKTRIAPGMLAGIMADEGFHITFCEVRSGMITIIGKKG